MKKPVITVAVARIGCAAAAAAIGPCAARAGEAARPADSFVESIGVNTHAALPWTTSFTHWDEVIAAVKDIGVRYVRDLPDDAERLNALTAATGAKVSVIVQYGWVWDSMDADHFDAAWARTVKVKDVAFLELPNEASAYPDWLAKIHNWANRMFEARRQTPALADVPIASTAIAEGALIADLRPIIDVGNMHVYPYTRVDDRRAGWIAAATATVGPGKPLMVTEFGFTTIPAAFSERAQATLLPRVYFDNYRVGISKSFVYDLVDDGIEPDYRESHYGITRVDGSYKPAAVALKNIIHLLADPAGGSAPPVTPSSLDFSLTGATDDLRHVLLQKRDGTFWLALWQEVSSVDADTRADLTIDPLAVTVHLDRPVVLATRYVPNDSASAMGSVLHARDVGVGVDDRITLLSLVMAGPGDANADGIVDRFDFATLLRNYDSGTTWEQGDFDLDGRVGFHDLQLLQMNYGRGFSVEQQAALAAAGIEVPEPGVGMVALGAMGLIARRTRRRSR